MNPSVDGCESKIYSEALLDRTRHRIIDSAATKKPSGRLLYMSLSAEAIAWKCGL
jgi:hypothetical protein